MRRFSYRKSSEAGSPGFDSDGKFCKCEKCFFSFLCSRRRLVAVVMVKLLEMIKFSIFRSDFKANIPVSDPNSVELAVELRPNIQVFQAAASYLLITKNLNYNVNSDEYEEHREKMENLWRYVLASIESESPKLSYVGLALNKDQSLAWIRHIKQLLLRCCLTIDSLDPKTHRDSVTLALILRTLISLTCPNSWAILRVKQLSAMKPALQQICNNILGFLIQKGLYTFYRVRMQFFSFDSVAKCFNSLNSSFSDHSCQRNLPLYR